MAKDKTKVDVEPEQKVQNKTRCFKRIGRKIQPKQFESLEVTCEYEDVVTWSDMDERQKKLEMLTQLAMIDFERSMSAVCEGLGVEHKPISITIKKDDGSLLQGATTSSLKPEETKNIAPKSEDLENWFDGIK
jgi:hypothetical protein